MLVAIALLVRRYYTTDVTTKGDQLKFTIFLVVIVASSIATSAYWAVSDGWIGYAITVPIWLLGTLGLSLFVPQAKTPKIWGVPFVPWLPSVSIGINIFLLGSIDGASFVRFGIWTGVILVYYIFFGLHASYDTAKEAEKQKGSGVEFTKAEEGDLSISY
ncbi:Cationic amino acid transporter 1 [Morus notabilis]|uniref:Cationic amino acid transporter 1 n=1 Tax=Morus notabilis TaxID=981085 RepID=W9QZ98_9ROSA|nr:Cationic amino acid transporter 1 [Morus notabilis]